MSLSLDNEMNIEVVASFIVSGTDGPLTGSEYLVRLYDKDVMNDDFLGESTPDEHGVAKFNISSKSFAGKLGLDNNPDFYLVVLKNNGEIFRTVVMNDLDLAALETFKLGEGEVVDLGTFLVRG